MIHLNKSSYFEILIQEEYFNSITQFCYLLFDFSISCKILIDQEYHFFVSSIGLKIKQIERTKFYCYNALKHEIYENGDIINNLIYIYNTIFEELHDILLYSCIPLTSTEEYNICTLLILYTKKMYYKIRILFKTNSINPVNHLELNIKKIEIKTPKYLNIRLIIGYIQLIINIISKIRIPHYFIFFNIEELYMNYLDDKKRENNDNIKTSFEYLIYLINYLLEIIKIEENKIIIEDSNFYIFQNIYYMYRLTNNNASCKIIYLNLDVDNKSPKKIIGCKINFNVILINLISDGIKFTNKKLVNCKLNFSEESVGDLRIGISITREGIPGSILYINKKLVDIL